VHRCQAHMLYLTVGDALFYLYAKRARFCVCIMRPRAALEEHVLG
jgi:hypothetical protein